MAVAEEDTLLSLVHISRSHLAQAAWPEEGVGGVFAIASLPLCRIAQVHGVKSCRRQERGGC